MSVITMKQLLEAGVHFGHQTRKWNPKMKRYIYAARNDIYIIDLQITVGLIEEAYKFVAQVAREGKPVLFVGTKKQAQEAIQQEAERCGQYFVNSRWLGGTLTNHKTIRTRIDRLSKLNQMEKMGEFELLTKKEVAKLRAERDRLEANLGGIKDMRTMPGCMFVVDPKKEAIAIREARNLNIPIVAIVDTNCDPDEADYVIPGNDDAIRAIKLISSVIADAVIEGNQGEQSTPEEKLEETIRTVRIQRQQKTRQATAVAVETPAPEVKPEETPEAKPEVKPEEAPEVKPEVEAEAVAADEAAE